MEHQINKDKVLYLNSVSSICLSIHLPVYHSSIYHLYMIYMSYIFEYLSTVYPSVRLSVCYLSFLSASLATLLWGTTAFQLWLGSIPQLVVLEL